MARDKQARAARRAAERAELERRRLEAKKRETEFDAHRKAMNEAGVTQADAEHAARHMQVSEAGRARLLALLTAAIAIR